MSLLSNAKKESKWYQITFGSNPDIEEVVYHMQNSARGEDGLPEVMWQRPAHRITELCDSLAKTMVMCRTGFADSSEVGYQERNLEKYLLERGVAGPAAKIYTEKFINACTRGINQELGAPAEQIKLG